MMFNCVLWAACIALASVKPALAQNSTVKAQRHVCGDIFKSVLKRKSLFSPMLG